MSDSDITRVDPIIGTPTADGDHFPGQQSYANACAIRCQEYILRQYTGIDAPEKVFIDEARAHGWYEDAHGTRIEDVGKLLELHGVPVHRYIDASVWHLASELGQGHKVITSIDSDKLGQEHPVHTEIRNALNFSATDHAVVVSGIDTSDPDHVNVIVSDPGTGEAAASYPMERFLSAWKDSEFFMMTTQEPPPIERHLPEMSHFNYEAGHIDHIGDLSWDQFQDAYHTHDDDALLRMVDPDGYEHNDAAYGEPQLTFDHDRAFGYDAALDHHTGLEHNLPLDIDPHGHSHAPQEDEPSHSDHDGDIHDQYTDDGGSYDE